MRIVALAAAALVPPTPTLAQDIKPLADARLRYEHAGQDGFAMESQALTLRLRAGAEFNTNDWSLLAEGEGTIALSDNYNSGLDDKNLHPIIADPENAELNRIQLQYRGLPKTAITLGRQRINLEDQRFVGSVGWRQNEQTFDAVRLEYGDAKGIRADLTYSWSVRTIWGINGADARQQAIGGNNVFASLGHPTPVGSLSGFAILVAQDEAEVQGHRLSSQTFGLRLADSHSITESTKLSYAVSYARQSDYRRNPNDYSADYWLAEAGVAMGALKLDVGHERLGADSGLPLTSFQTPLATLHKFQGWADKFLTTPPNGIRDWYSSINYGWKSVLGLDVLGATVAYHRFNSDRLRLQYGNEWDAKLSAKKGRLTATAKLAAYRANQFATDTTKFWLQMDWGLMGH